MKGLSAPVRIVRDRWGIPHIFASTADDLFFAQGFVQAEDRLFQMDLWRRASQGRLAEVLGSNFIGRDAMTRRVQYRGGLDEEWGSYGPDTRSIASAFVRGINAWIQIVEARPPVEFVLAGWHPDLWHPEDLLNRTDAFVASGNAFDEVLHARLATALGAARADALLGETRTVVPRDFDPSTVTFAVGNALRQIGTAPFFAMLSGDVGNAAKAAGSNAWAIAGRRSSTGGPLLAADPHRLFANPSLRYLVHLSAPGWNVIGATAPWMPGVTIGHNDRMAWGITAADADTVDLYVERVNPENRHQVEDQGHWQNTTVVTEPLWVKGRNEPVLAEREYTPRGVVVAVDGEKHLAFTLRWNGMQPGTAGELAALGIDRASSIDAFRDALTRWKTPSVDFVFVERAGAIGSQRAAYLPVRDRWNGEVAVPGWTDQFNWVGWKTSLELLAASAPAAPSYVASANGNRARTERLRGRLGGEQPLGVDEVRSLQQDVVAWNAQQLVPLLGRLKGAGIEGERARQQLLSWDRQMHAASPVATLYALWERHLERMLVEHRIPASMVDDFLPTMSNRLVPAVTKPAALWFDGNVEQERDRLLMDALNAAVDDLAKRRGPAADAVWGRLHAVLFSHPLAVDDAARRLFNVGPFPVAGYGDTVMSTGGRGLEATIGASLRVIFDASDWDRSLAQSAPGQSGNPTSAHFQDLAKLWAAGEYFPLLFSEAAIQRQTESTLILNPSK